MCLTQHSCLQVCMSTCPLMHTWACYRTGSPSRMHLCATCLQSGLRIMIYGHLEAGSTWAFAAVSLAVSDQAAALQGFISTLAQRRTWA